MHVLMTVHLYIRAPFYEGHYRVHIIWCVHHFPQVIAFFDALLRCEESGVKRVLVLCPVNTVNNWKIEFYKWIPFMQCDYMVSAL